MMLGSNSGSSIEQIIIEAALVLIHFLIVAGIDLRTE